MDIRILIQTFNQTIDIWIGELNSYDYDQLCLQPGNDTWSMGQLYEHLIEEAKYYFQQVDVCLSNNENEFENMTDTAKEWLRMNSFPDKQLVGPPGIQPPLYPGSKKQLLEDMKALKVLINKKGKEISHNPNRGKTKHPGFNYLNAAEWFQYADMHFRHHFKQKQRLDEFLKISRR